MAKRSSEFGAGKMATARKLSKSGNESTELLEPKGADFFKWGERFFAYLVKQKSGTNADLLELIRVLGDDGRGELALSIFNFLRTRVWRDFYQDRQKAKQRARKMLTRARSDLNCARVAHVKLLRFIPEVAICRPLGDSRRLHLADLMEKEAAFLATQARIERAAKGRLCRTRHAEPNQLERKVNSQNLALLSEASQKLTRAARSYRELLTITPTASIGKAFDALAPLQLGPALESEHADLRGFMDRVNPAFNKKRFGTKADWAILVRLQYLIEIFGLRWSSYLPQNVLRVPTERC
jgi:hypothetical protein